MICFVRISVSIVYAIFRSMITIEIELYNVYLTRDVSLMLKLKQPHVILENNNNKGTNKQTNKQN